MLERQADAPALRRPRTTDARRAERRHGQPRDDPREGRLAAAIRSVDDHRLAGIDAQVERWSARCDQGVPSSYTCSIPTRSIAAARRRARAALRCGGGVGVGCRGDADRSGRRPRRCRDACQPTGIECDHDVTVLGFVGVVRDVHDGRVATSETAIQTHQRAPPVLVDHRGRLVRHDQARRSRATRRRSRAVAARRPKAWRCRDSRSRQARRARAARRRRPRRSGAPHRTSSPTRRPSTWPRGAGR